MVQQGDSRTQQLQGSIENRFIIANRLALKNLESIMSAIPANKEVAAWRVATRMVEATPKEFNARGLVNGIAKLNSAGRPTGISINEVDMFSNGADVDGITVTPEQRKEYGDKARDFVNGRTLRALAGDVLIASKQAVVGFVKSIFSKIGW